MLKLARGAHILFTVATAALLVLLLAPPSYAGSTPGPAARSNAVPGHATPSPATPSPATPSHAAAGPVTEIDGSGLDLTIDTIDPVTLQPGERLRLSGTVTNRGDTRWRDAQVYLLMEEAPASTKIGLDTFADVPDTETFGTLVDDIGLFAEIGNVPPGTSKDYTLSIPYARLPISGDAGVYHVGVSVLAGTRDGRDSDAEARADTLIPLLPLQGEELAPTDLVTLVPMTAPVHRHTDGRFADDSLAAAVGPGGRLRNLLDFALRAPPSALQIAVDPAVLQAVQDMSRGYVVRTVPQVQADEPGEEGAGQGAARRWLRDFDRLREDLPLLLLPWASPDANALADASMPGVLEAAVRASQRYAEDENLDADVVGWQYGGISARRGISAVSRAGVDLQVVAESTLPRLEPTDESGYPPSVVSIPTRNGTTAPLVAAETIGGEQITPDTPGLAVRQLLLAEGAVRSLHDEPSSRIAVSALPFRWDPGPRAGSVDLAGVFGLSSLTGQSVDLLAQEQPVPYDGPVQGETDRTLAPAQLKAIAGLRDRGGTYLELLTDPEAATTDYYEDLGEASSAGWRLRPKLGTALTRTGVRLIAEDIAKVTITGPTFVALSAESGRFPLTVTNGLDVPVSVKIDVTPENAALRVSTIETLELEPGQRRDIEVTSQADGSGLTRVTARLMTVEDRPFGERWSLDVRATQIGVVIWVLMGAGAVVLFGAAGYRIVKRVRTSSLTPREEPLT